MPEPIYVIIMFAVTAINVISIAMFIRVLLGIFQMDENNKFFRFCVVITEPVILPLRKLFHKKNWFQQIPFDMSFMFSWLLLSFIKMILEMSL